MHASHKGFKPEYPADIITLLPTTEGSIEFAQNYFVVTLKAGKESITFAAKPEPIDPIC